MVRGFLIPLIVLSYLYLFPLEKRDILFAKSVSCQKEDDGESQKSCYSRSGKVKGDNEKLIYRVKKGDNLSSIANRYELTVDEIMQWNQMNEHDIYRGQKLVIFKPAKKEHQLLPGQSIILQVPVSHWVIIKGYKSYGDSKNFGLLCRVSGKNTIKPANEGTVVKVSSLRGYGKYILIDHGNGWHSMYSNIIDVKVKSGQHVNLSETIGSAKDNKLFFLLAYNGKPVNPLGYFKTAERN